MIEVQHLSHRPVQNSNNFAEVNGDALISVIAQGQIMRLPPSRLVSSHLRFVSYLQLDLVLPLNLACEK